jgi:hypothetical protein
MKTNVVDASCYGVDKVIPFFKSLFVRRLNHLFLFCGLFFAATRLQADTIYFNDLDRGPADSLTIGGVTISSFQVPGQPPADYEPTTVAGVGLGGSSVAPGYSVDARFHYSPGGLFTDSPVSGRTERLSFTVDGNITAFTVVPYRPFVVGSGDEVMAPFSLEWQGPGILGSDLQELSLTDLNPVTIQIHQQVSGVPFNSLALYNNVDSLQEGNFVSYRMDHVDEDQTIQWGFTILSLDYTPVPEPGSAALLAVGGVVFWSARRRRNSAPRF